MIRTIKENKQLKPYLRGKLEDEGIQVDVSGDIEEEQIANIKVDDYYAGLHLALTPKTIDFLTAVDCECDTYVLYLLEFKNVGSPSGLVTRDIHEKFENTLNDFMSERFKDIFLNDRFKYRKILLYLVSNGYRVGRGYKNFSEYRAVQEKIHNRDSLKTDMSLANKPFSFRGKVLKINFDIPPNPVVRRYL